jgi:phage tail sheath protein FI
MAELTFKSAGVSTREIDVSQPSTNGPSGTPAGIIGTSLKGPAFVPITISNNEEFISLFGNGNSGNVGPLAVHEWLKSAQSCTFIRVLGVGDGKQRNADGSVQNAGFVIGDQILQSNGQVKGNKYANAGSGDIKGRTYFLGTLMSESNGSTIFSAAGIQTDISEVQAMASFTCVQHMTGVIVLKDSAGIRKSYHFGTSSANGTAVIASGSHPVGVQVKTNGLSAANIAANFIGVLSSSDAHNGTITSARTDAIGHAAAALAHFTQSFGGVFGNGAIEYNADTIAGLAPADRATSGVRVDGIVKDATFASGSTAGGAVPILRGVLLAPSGVILHLSGNITANGSDAPTATNTAASASGMLIGREGSLTGSLDMTNGKQEFVLLLNGFKGNNTNLTHITASFDPLASNYMSRVLNIDPLKIEEKGHLLYSHYPIHGNIAKVTGSYSIRPGNYSFGAPNTFEDISFLLTGSNARNLSSGFGDIPDYEDFQDRFSHAETPYITSQKFGNKSKNLFKLVCLNAGSDVAEEIKISIENLVKSTSDSNKYGTFDLLVRKGSDNDFDRNILESFRGINLDPASDRFVGRVIGDQEAKFDFDVASNSQKLIVLGSHPVRSKFIRVKLADNLSAGNIPDEALPFGYRGVKHLVTSGSMLSSEADNFYAESTLLNRVIEPPFPLRENISTGTGLSKDSDSRFYWGVQETLKISTDEKNKISTNEALSSLTPLTQNYQKFFPTHRKNTTATYVGENEGTPDVNGSVLDCDKFNYNGFSLENISVRTGSSTDSTYTLADSENWLSASYIRAGNISANSTLKTRALSIDDLGETSNRKYIKFTLIPQGGFDGVNIFNSEKLNLTNNACKYEIDQKAVQGGVSGPTIAGYRKALDIMGSKSDVDIQVLATPGIRNAIVTDHAISIVENRFDCLYIMDIEEKDQVNSVVTSSIQSPSVTNTITNFKNRLIDSSFAAAYFPDVSITNYSNGNVVNVPPSVVVLGAISRNDLVANPWNAPAGKNRGMLNAVESTNVKLNRNNLDNLYDAKINPITTFPGTPVTIWGQKTILQNASALSRINVRRLLISVRRSVRNIANSILFEPNRESTLEKFSALVNPILQNIQEKGGVSKYKVIIDSSTTTQADIENNTIRGKIYLQPIRTVEFVALDFVVSNTGAEI